MGEFAGGALTSSIGRQRLATKGTHCYNTNCSVNATLQRKQKGDHLIIDDVPAWVCEQCGEPLFDEETVDTIQEMLRGVDARLKRLAVPSATV